MMSRLELYELIKSVNFVDIARILRPGHEPTVHIPEDPASLQGGGMNVHLPILFEDGVKWAVRIKQQEAHNLPVEHRAMVIKSEVGTMKALKAAGLKVPEVKGEVYSMSWISHLSLCALIVITHSLFR
jgi:hypothetical protein